MIRRPPTHRGFTLVELMVVVAIVGVLGTLAVMSIRSNDYSDRTRSFTEQLAGLIDETRWRATSSQRWQMVTVSSDGVWVDQLSGTGAATGIAALPMAGTTPDTSSAQWASIRTIRLPQGIEISSTDTTPHLDPGDSVPAVGDGLPAFILLSPDGTVRDTGWTVFLTDDRDNNRARVVLFRASGTVSVLEGW